MDRGGPPSNLVFIDQIVKDQSGGVNYLKCRSRVECILRISSEGFRRKNDQQRSAAFASSLEHVFDNLIRFLSVEIRFKSIVDFLLNRTSPTLEDRRKDAHSSHHLVEISSSRCSHPYLIG